MAIETIAVVGITGNQGGSVADVYINAPGWKVRGISRDPSKPSSQDWISKGAEVVAGDLDDVDSLKRAFSGASVIFGVTDFFTAMYNPHSQARAQKEGLPINAVAYDYELQQGKNVVDAAAANIETIDRFVFSTLSSTSKWSNGKITTNYHFDSKAATVDYLKETYPELAKKTSYVLLTVYASNWRYGLNAPTKQDDGSYKVKIPMSGDSTFPIVDARADTGSFVKALVDLPAGKSLAAASELTSWNEFWCTKWAKHVGVTCTYEKQDRKELDAMGPFGSEMADMFQFMDEFGYDGGDPNIKYAWDVDADIKVTNMDDYIKSQDWSQILK